MPATSEAADPAPLVLDPSLPTRPAFERERDDEGTR